jgi:Lanthionine synthetase C-like protein
LTKFARVESRLSGLKRQRKVIFYAPVTLCARRACSASVAVGLGVESPGLMTGLAGIGYGLLRLAEPTRVPSVLVLTPPTP